jgi:hypothetical protein
MCPAAVHATAGSACRSRESRPPFPSRRNDRSQDARRDGPGAATGGGGAARCGCAGGGAARAGVRGAAPRGVGVRGGGPRVRKSILRFELNRWITTASETADAVLLLIP